MSPIANTSVTELGTGRVPVGVFTIQEVELQGSTFAPVADGAHFEWTSARRPADASKGGARAAPLQPWTMGGRQRTVRTDYAGARTPSIQVLGPNHTPTSLNGRWDDRYNYIGYAAETKDAFERLCQSGAVVRIQFQNETFVGIITDWSFEYYRSWFIRYSFTLDPYERPEHVTKADISPKTTKSTVEAYDDIDLLVVSILKTDQDLRSPQFLDDDLNSGVRDDLGTLLERQNALGDTLDGSAIANSYGRGVSPFQRIATQFRSVSKKAGDIIDKLIEARSDNELKVRTAMTVLDYEEWSRTMRFQARLIKGSSASVADEMGERDEPKAQRLYRPMAGESLYNISRRFYGTPFAWRLIAQRNNLTSVKLTGDELLVIPERGEG